MMIMILEKTQPSLRGELSRWLIEPKVGVFIGHVNAMVRDRLWDKCCLKCKDGGVFQAWSTNNEQHYKMRAYGNTSRVIIEMEGLQLIKILPEEKK